MCSEQMSHKSHSEFFIKHSRFSKENISSISAGIFKIPSIVNFYLYRYGSYDMKSILTSFLYEAATL